MPTHTKYPKRLNVYVTAEMQRKLTQIRDQRGPQVTVPDVVREAIRLYVDDQEQIIGSRRHFQKTLREEIELAQRVITWNQIVLMVMVSHWLSPVVSAVSKQPLSGRDLFVKAMSQAANEWASYQAALDLGLEKTFAADEQTGGGK